MTDTTSGDSSKAESGDASETDSGDSSEPDAAFAAVSDPTRIAILRELASHARETGEETVGFAALRKRAGVEDSGRFRYHLNTLVGHFVAKEDDGYRLSHAGFEIVAAILAGRYTDHEQVGPTAVDGACNVCGAEATGVYENGRLEVTCANDHPLLSWAIPPNAATDATVNDLATLATSLIRHAIDLALQGVCSECYGTMTTRITSRERDEDGSNRRDERSEDRNGGAGDSETSDKRTTPVFRGDCEMCAASLVGPAWFALTVHPTVDAFYHDHGLAVRDALLWELGHVEYDTKPVRDDDSVVISVVLDDERLDVTLSETGHVLETDVGPV
ncbi:helix-turn-helix transcriptional regulator [Halogeometricum borinquense]|uniref:Helix-turn-helix transcriptional regulator n=1 Tax=Halogeometricum borinquense TaxID=60847 RepID=A0A6C0UGW2_9EURY|nr:helix-turn-helix domain-containing protein [Halogeometricum borinquense]QIB74447.1 helix-turn-helix transcriptional regulator [Halogeometricum borinquense]